MTNIDLAQSYLIKAQARLKALHLLHEEKDYSDVVRESQETVELALKAMLRFVGIDPPKFHDVGNILLEHRSKFKSEIASELPKAATISKRLRKERELSFYGDIDFIPTQEYSEQDSKIALEGAIWVVSLATQTITLPS
jgi:HEPN domain-containing protein